MVTAVIPADLVGVVSAQLRGEIEDLTPIQHKVAHRMFHALWHSSDGLQPIIIRFYHSTRCDEEARIEAAALRELSRMGYPVPELFRCVDDAAMVGAPFIVMQRLKGHSLGQVALENPTRIPYWIELAATLLARLHKLEWQNGFDMFQPPMETLDFAERQVKWWAREATKVEATETQAGFAWLKAHLFRARDCGNKSIVHRDFHPNNLMADGDSITGVLDWGELAIADPAIDVAWTRMVMDTEVSSDLASRFNAAYQRRNPEVAATQHFWEVFAACKRLTTMAHIRRAQELGLAAHDGNLPPVQQKTWDAVRQFMEARLEYED